MKKWLAALLLAVLVALAGSALADSTTIMVYMCGTDLQSDCVVDINEICAAVPGDGVNIVVLAGGAKKWDDRRLAGGRLNLFSVRGGAMSAVTDWGKASMGSADTLQKFITYARGTFPAERYMLILWDHGGGAGDGICFDELFRDDGLTLTEIEAALRGVRAADSSFRLSLLGCDACMMGAYEMAVVAGEYADYFIASEELEPWTGWDYTPWLSALARDPGMSTESVGRAIIDAYAAGVKRERAQEYTTLSLIDTARLAPLRQDMELLSIALAQALDNGQLATISRMLSRMYAYGTFDTADGDWDMYDLGDVLNICAQFAPTVAAQARAHLADCVTYAYASGDMPVASGLSILVPNKGASHFLTDTLKGYGLSALIPNYVDFVTGLSARMNGSSYSFQAAAPALAPAQEVASSQFGYTSPAYGFVPAASYNAETSIPGFIAGSAGAAATPAPNASTPGGVPGFIAGSAGAAATPAPNASTPGNAPGFIAGSAGAVVTPAPVAQLTVNGVPGFIAGSANPGVVAPVQASDPESDLSFSLQLSLDAVSNLSYVEGALFADLSDEDSMRMLELGYMRNSWVDWATNRVYSSFDGSWPSLGGQPVVLYDQSCNAAARRSLIPVTVNGKATCLVVIFDGNARQGRIIGYNDGVDANGLPIRRTEALKPGDVIVPLYSLFYCSWDEAEDENAEMQEDVIKGDPVIWREDLLVDYVSLGEAAYPSDYSFVFYLNDIFGDMESSDLFPFTL